MPAPSAEIHQKYAIRKSQSVGGFIPNNKAKAKETNTTVRNAINEEKEDHDITPTATPVVTPLTSRKKPHKLGNLFKWFGRSAESPVPKNNDNDNDIYSKIKKNQALKALEKSIFSNGTNISSNLKPASSVESICSVGSTASFSYVPINNGKKSKKPKVIPLGPTCGSDTYRQRVDQRRKRVVEDLNISLSTKYKLQPAEYSPPNTLLRQNENLSAISGPSLPSGPNFHVVESPKVVCKKKDSVSSSSEEDEDEEEESTLSYSSSWTKSSYSAVQMSRNGGGGMSGQLIKPKERLGQSMQAKTITNKNSLMEIGNVPGTANNSAMENCSPSLNQSHSQREAFQLSRSDTLKG